MTVLAYGFLVSTYPQIDAGSCPAFAEGGKNAAFWNYSAHTNRPETGTVG